MSEMDSISTMDTTKLSIFRVRQFFCHTLYFLKTCVMFSITESGSQDQLYLYNSNDIILPDPSFEAIPMNFLYQVIKVWLEIHEVM